MSRFLIAAMVLGSIGMSSVASAKGSAFLTKKEARGIANQNLRRQDGTFSGVDVKGKSRSGKSWVIGKATERGATQDISYVNVRTGKERTVKKGR